ncbi:DNA methyltransferase [Moorella sulfitireducens]|uniref:DNA methyltransferase n=1 Tax=Neomoorella sulfitireducens TaxID=2972948 RepID=UPI0021AC66EC|nr:site-specific DNA-methyltransferase [Moorella sulfitireducens]
MPALNEHQRRHIIELLEQGADLPADYKNLLFPPERQEYELVYAGKEREEDILTETMAVPLQPVKTFFTNGHNDDWCNMLIFGDNLQAMKSLLRWKETGRLANADNSPGVRLIYIDPPFATRQEYRSTQEERAYQDKLIGARFIEFLRKRLVLMKHLLADNGSIYVHLDEKKSHYIKVIMDEIFGESRFQREIIWRIGWLSGFKTQAKNWIRNHDVLFFYTKSDDFIFNKIYLPYPEGYTRRDGSPPEGAGYPVEDTWNCYELDHLDSIQIMSFSGEKTGFPTQKNENLLERIIRASSNPGDIVLDAFAGSGTTLAVAEKLGRRWIGIDSSKLAIYTIQKRLLTLKKEIGNRGEPLTPKPFVLYNTGVYDYSQLQGFSWQEWRFIALHLFQCRDEPHMVGGVQWDGYLGTDDVLVFNHLHGGGAVLDHILLTNCMNKAVTGLVPVILSSPRQRA